MVKVTLNGEEVKTEELELSQKIIEYIVSLLD
jgi:hypothetical protein|nr:MAG TPA: hypothetical protein [Caudoviricetes sp.]